MPTFIPPYMGEEIKSAAEKKMFDVLKELDMDDAFVLHSLGLPRHQSKLYGETDFVIVCKRGVACLEIKGGRVECRDGAWIYTDRYGIERQKPEGPFAQAAGNMFSLMTELRTHFQLNPHIKKLLAACGVMFPDIVFKSVSEEVIPEIIYDARTTSITEYINRVFDYWEERQHREPSPLSPADISAIVGFLRGSFSFIPTLGDRLNSVEKRLVRLTEGQTQVMNALSLNSHLLIEGSAGTGKTLLAVDFARKRAAQGDRVLYLTFNKNLANNINAGLRAGSKPALQAVTGASAKPGKNADHGAAAKSGAEPKNEAFPNLKVINIHALFAEYVPVDIDRMNKNPKEYFEEELPEAFFDYLGGLSAAELDGLRYDLLVIDEGQDILRPLYLYSLDILLKNGLERGNWVIFYDELQNIYNPEYAAGMELIESYPNARFRLFVNCRNTVQIGTYSSRVSGVEIKEFLQENGEEVQCISYADEKDFKQKLKDLMKHMREEKVNASDIAFLGPKKYENSILSRAGFAVNELGDDFDEESQLPRYATIQGFKGLDSKIAVLVDVDSLRDENFSRYIYIAGTRARTLLYILASDEFRKRHESMSVN